MFLTNLYNTDGEMALYWKLTHLMSNMWGKYLKEILVRTIKNFEKSRF